MEKLWLKYATNTCDKTEFDRWLDAVLDERQNENIEKLLKKQWDAQFPKTEQNKLSQRWYFRAAATVLLLLGFGIFVWNQHRETAYERALVYGTEYTQEDAPVSHVRLPDGSTVALRGDSRLDMRNGFEGETREILLEGEAFFDITSDPNRPFIIHTGGIRTTVLGTAFAIRAMPGESLITITVAEGKVKVKDGDRLLTFLETDQQLVFDVEHEFVQEFLVDAGRELSWMPNELIFRNMSFGEIVRKLSDIYNVSILFENDYLKYQRITTSLDRREPIEFLLKILSATQQSYYIFEGGSFIIRSH